MKILNVLGLTLALSIAACASPATSNQTAYSVVGPSCDTTPAGACAVGDCEDGFCEVKHHDADCKGDKKALICHVPPGNPGNEHTICVGKPSVPAHMAHGDRDGACGPADGDHDGSGDTDGSGDHDGSGDTDGSGDHDGSGGHNGSGDHGHDNPPAPTTTPDIIN